ncbi:LysR family transcriptional regulator [Alteromonas sp. KUL49]|uniref:LysR family transcriptional regulator n=1 Tax=Alteromonas sp. KUL49 TaxID=2480798 RepID=UPI00102F29A8|nr:LysR family transcriptional regulator [Alteromonas sp. KUL49]TAP33893.1 LysR family transcriptional regulator [Alteromonas sp. KUL49]GEA13657.1 LysR family transcriptional regulator [Alteromonas sp. KUL49]
MNDWDDYQLVLALHRGKTLRGGAKILGLNHSTLSRKLARLHQVMGAEVFEPTSQGLAITPFGKQLLATATKMEQVANQAKAEYCPSEPLTGEVNLSLPPALFEFVLMEDIARFCHQYPQIKVNVQTGYHFANIEKGEADVVVRVADKPGDDLVGHRLFPLSLGFYANPDYLAATPESEYQWITSTDMNKVRGYLPQSPYPKAKIGFTLDDLVLRHKAAAQGHGLILGACYIADTMSELTALNDTRLVHQEIWVLTHQRLSQTPRIKCLMQYLLHAIRAKQDNVLL